MSNVRELAKELLAEKLAEKSQPTETALTRAPIELNIYQASLEFLETAESIRKGLRRQDLTVEAGWTYTLREIYVALAGDFTFERTRVEREKADKLIREKEVDAGRLVEWERVVTKLNQKIKLPMQNAFDNAPTAVDREWLEKVLKPILMQSLEQMRDEIVEERKRES